MKKPSDDKRDDLNAADAVAAAEELLREQMEQLPPWTITLLIQHNGEHGECALMVGLDAFLRKVLSNPMEVALAVSLLREDVRTSLGED